jgi:hypothetical protein
MVARVATARDGRGVDGWAPWTCYYRSLLHDKSQGR